MNSANGSLSCRWRNLAGHEVEDEVKEQIEHDYQLLCMNSDINEYLNAEYLFSLMLSDIQGAIAEAVPEWFNFNLTGSPQNIN